VSRGLAAVAALAIAIGLAGVAAGKRTRAERKAFVRNSMPPGWTWPPSKAMRRAGDACKAKLDELGITWEKAGKRKKIATPIVVPDMVLGGISFDSTWERGPHVMDCHLALALAQHAPHLRELGVQTVKFSSIHRYDFVELDDGLRWPSGHALGTAMDVKAFVDQAGNEAWVEEGYMEGNELLLRVEEYLDGTGAFRPVLSPRNDPGSHSDHFHVHVKVDYSGS
jgi:hypothetical protein